MKKNSHKHKRMRLKAFDSPACCMSLRSGGRAAWAFVSLLLLSSRAASFSWPQSKLSPSTVRLTRPSVRSRRQGRDEVLHQSPLLDSDRITPFVQDGTSTTPSLEPNSDATLFERELLEGYIAYQSLLSSVDNELNLERPALDEYSEPLESGTYIINEPASVVTHATKSSPSTIIPILSDVWKARLLLLLSAALYGTNFTFVKSLDESMSVGTSSTLRFGFAAVAMLPWLFAPIDEELKVLTRERRKETGNCSEDGVGQKRDIMFKVLGDDEPTRLSAVLCGMEIGLYNSIGYIAQAVGLKTTTASKSAFICSMAVVTVPILDYIWGKELLRRQVIGACLAALGVWALELGGQENTFTDGDIMSLIQPLMFGLGFWRMEAAMQKYPTEAGRLAAAQLLMVFLISLSYLLCWSPVGDDLLLTDSCNALPTASDIIAWLQDPYILGMLLWTGIVTTAFTIWMETLALKTLSAAETTLIFSTEPLFGAAFAAVVANECLGTEAAIGAAFIIGGCIVSGMDVSHFFTPKDGVATIKAPATDKLNT